MILLTAWFLSHPSGVNLPLLTFVPGYRALDTALRASHCGATKVELAYRDPDAGFPSTVVWTAEAPRDANSPDTRKESDNEPF